MKKILYTICLATAPLFFQACDNLDLAPIDYTASGSYWQNEAHVSNFVVGLHNDLRAQLGTQHLQYGEYRSEIINTGTNVCGTSTKLGNYLTNTISESSTLISNWGGFYGKILQVNVLIEQLETGCGFLTDSQRNYYKGVAYGLRAYYYFWLYRSYGGVPLELEVKVGKGSISAPDLYLARSTAEATLSQIKSDVETSLTAFGNTTQKSKNYYHWSKDASLMLKGEVYLWSAKVTTDDRDKAGVHTGNLNKDDLTTAKNALTQITGYELEGDFSQLFKQAGKLNNKEVILALYYNKDETTSGHARDFFHHPSFNGNSVVDEDGNALGDDPIKLEGSGLQYNEYKESFVKAYDKADSRRAATFFEYYRASDNKFGCNMLKFFGQTIGTTHYFDPDVILYRYADVVLMLAEIENGLGNDCSSYINQIRKRAYGDNYSDAVKYTKGTFAENELAILKERDKEFVGEGKRWFDLLRLMDASKNPLVFSVDAAYGENGDVYSVLDKSTEAYKILWPINSAVIQADPLLKQTVNYETIY